MSTEGFRVLGHKAVFAPVGTSSYRGWGVGIDYFVHGSADLPLAAGWARIAPTGKSLAGADPPPQMEQCM